MFVLWALLLTLLVLGLLPRLRFLAAFAAPILLAVGVLAVKPPVTPSEGVRTAMRVGMYDRLVDWVVWNDPDGNLLTVFPLANDAPGASR